MDERDKLQMTDADRASQQLYKMANNLTGEERENFFDSLKLIDEHCGVVFSVVNNVQAQEDERKAQVKLKQFRESQVIQRKGSQRWGFLKGLASRIPFIRR